MRRAGVPMAFSAGFHPHPRISYANAAPTGAASESEYFQLQLTQSCDVEKLRQALDDSLPADLAVLRVVEAAPGALADLLQASVWQLDFEGVAFQTIADAVTTFMGRTELLVTRMTKSGAREFDVRQAVLASQVTTVPVSADVPRELVRWTMTIQHTTPAVRPNDVMTGLVDLTGLAIARPPLMTRLVQGTLGPGPVVGDPFDA